MSDPFGRYEAILVERGMVPFQRAPWVNPRTERVEPGVLGERPRMRWRVAPDELDRLHAETGNSAFGPMAEELFGWPIDADVELAPGTILFEAAE